jgi:hypothetical protein
VRSVAWRALAGVVLMCLPAAAAAATLAAGAFAIGQPAAIDYGEPVVYGHAQRIVTGDALYQPIDRPPFTVAAYTPLYYWAAGVLQAAIGPGFGSGRALSLAAGLVAAVCVGALAGRSRGAWVGALGSALFLALAFPTPDTPWLGLYRVDVLGVALSLAAIVVLSVNTDRRAVVLAGVLAGLALLTKQTFFAAVLAGAVWLWPRPWIFLVTAAATFAVPCVLLELTTGAFVQNTVAANANPFYLSIALGLLPQYLATQSLPLVLAAVYLVVDRPWHSRNGRLVVVYWVATSVSLVGIAKIGANHNYWIELAAATAILAARGAAAVVHASNPLSALVGAVALMLVLGSTIGGPPGWVASARAARADVRSALQPASDAEFDMLVDRVRREPGLVIAEPLDVVVLAGRSVVLEPFIYSILLDLGQWRAESLVDRICNGDVALVVLAYPLEVGASMTDGLHALWPMPVMAALQDTMSLESMHANRYVYRQRDGAECHVGVEVSERNR